jgi:indolepyruvate ferredoxin oxidoreductase
VEKAVRELKAAQRSLSNLHEAATRIPYFCSGCPHNSSTVIPEGGRGYAGIGCHWMAQYVQDRNTEGATHMGGEGVNWVGESHFSKRKHVFQNIGDGTYNHSGILAIRAAVASNTTMTYKILFNDAVAMTGGQAHEGGLTVPQIARQVAAEGVTRVVIVSDEPDKYTSDMVFPPFTSFHHRREIQTVQKELMNTEGVTALIYDQTCAAEKRRRRKRGTFPDPAKRVFINELVCEGCGDCGVKSNCVAIQPVETEFGRKRRIDQSACNKDYSCINGFCPSFVTIEGGELKKSAATAKTVDAPVFEAFPQPELPSLENPWAVLVTGIGGTGVVTVGQIISMAAHLEGKGAAIIDMAGLSQKNGAVVSHLKISTQPEDIASIRVAAGGADLILGCDLVTAAAEHNLATVGKGRTTAIVNEFETMPAMFAQDADYQLPGDALRLSIEARTGPKKTEYVNATRIATALMGDSIASNMFMLGYSWQKGLLPIGREAIERAITMNGVAIEMNLAAFEWGRRAAHNLQAVEKVVASQSSQGETEISTSHDTSRNLDEMISRRMDFLIQYQNFTYAEKYRGLVERVRAGEEQAKLGSNNLTKAVARYAFKLMAYKDEYEVARLYTDTGFRRAVADTFSGEYVIKHHLAPPLFSRRDPETGHLLKKEFGPWMMTAFGFLAKFKGLRGTFFDPFGYSSERKVERALIGDYENLLDELVEKLTGSNIALATEIASLPEHIRGYGHVKERHLANVREQQTELLEAYRSGGKAPIKLAAE